MASSAGPQKWNAYFKEFRAAHPTMAFKAAQQAAKKAYAGSTTHDHPRSRSRSRSASRSRSRSRSGSRSGSTKKKKVGNPAALKRFNAALKKFKLANPGMDHREAQKAVSAQQKKASSKKKKPSKKPSKKASSKKASIKKAPKTDKVYAETRISPHASAVAYPANTKMYGHDGRVWRVKAYTRDGKKVKTWVLAK